MEKLKRKGPLLETELARISKMTPEQHIAELDLSLNEILEHPENWNQAVWVCETGFCLAGNAAARSGLYLGARIVGADNTYEGAVVDYQSRSMRVAHYAAKLFGLDMETRLTLDEVEDSAFEDRGTRWESNMLFHGDNTITDLFMARNIIAKRRGLRRRPIPHKRIQRAELIAFATNKARQQYQPGYEMDIPEHFTLRQKMAFKDEWKRQEEARRARDRALSKMRKSGNSDPFNTA